MTLPYDICRCDNINLNNKQKDRCFHSGLSLSKKSSESWAFSVLCGIMIAGDERCWNEEKWNEESLKS